MRKIMTWFIIGILIGLVIGGIGGYFISSITNKFIQGRGNFQIDKTTKNEIISFFNNTQDINTINSYCNQNRMYCVYYCRNINPDDEACKQIINLTKAVGGRQWNP